MPEKKKFDMSSYQQKIITKLDKSVKKEVEMQKKLAATGDEKQKAKAAAKLDKLLTPGEKDEIAAAEKEKGEKERIKKGDLKKGLMRNSYEYLE